MLPWSKCTGSYPHTQERKKGQKKERWKKKERKMRDRKIKKRRYKKEFELDSS